MSVTNYSIDKCRYIHTKLKDVLYIVSSEHVKNIHIDGNEVYIDGFTELPLRLNGFNIQLNEESSLDERYKFQKTLTLSMTGYVNYKIFGGRYYAIVEDLEGTFYMINVDFPSRITHTFNLSRNTNQTDFTFASLSNYPTMKLNADFEAVSPVCIGLNVYGIDKLQLLEVEKAKIDTENRTVITTEDFKNIEYLGNSCSFQEIYDGFKVTDTITFDIPFNSQLQWSWKLLEFLNNKYCSIIIPRGNDNKYYSGFNFGLQPSYTIQTASNDGQSDVITVTLTETSPYGATAAVDWSDEHSTTTTWKYVKNVGDTICYRCVGLGQAQYLVKQEVNAFGVPTDNYQVYQGTESQYPQFNIVGTFSNVELFANNDCSDYLPCDMNTTLPSNIVFTSQTCNNYTLSASCDWSFTDIPSGITISPSSGNANTTYTVSVCNTIVPTDSSVDKYPTFNCCYKSLPYKITISGEGSFINPTVMNIDCLAQNVLFVFDSNCPITVTGADFRLTYQITYSQLIVRVPRNNTTSAITWQFIVKDCQNNQQTITINQDKTYEAWVDQGGYTCESGNSYSVQRRFTGTTADSLEQTGETRKGSLIQSGDTRCKTAITKWEWDNESYDCQNGNKYKIIFEWISFDNGSTWAKTGNTELGEMVESASTYCASAVTYSWVLTTDYVCESVGPEPTPPAPLLKFYASYESGLTYSAECDSSLILTSGETTPSGYDNTEMLYAEVGDCVTSIGNYAFRDCNSLTEIKVGSGITSIGKMAFENCRGLTSIDIPSGVTSIGSETFRLCGSLTSIDIPSGVTTIGDETFLVCSGLTSVTIGSGVISIGNYAFGYCYGLPSITIPDSVTSIDYMAFGYCYSLSSVTIGSGLTTIGGAAFYQCSGLTSIDIPDSVTTIGQSAFIRCYGLTSATIGNGVTEISEWCFASCSGLTNVTIGSGVTTIGQRAFHGCRGLTSIDIPSGVTSIESSAFTWCDNLSSVTVNAITPPTLGTSVFGVSEPTIYVPCESLNAYKTASGWSDYASSIQAISNDCLSTKFKATYSAGTTYSAECDSETTLTTATTKASGNNYSYQSMVSAEIGDCITTIGFNAFYKCSGLTSCTIGSGVTSIGTQAFYQCSGLTSVTIPSGVTSIGESAFYYCFGLTSINIPSGVTSIGDYAFEWCDYLTSITINATTPPTLGSNVFRTLNNYPIYVPSGSVNTYKSASGWSNYADRIQAIQ